jgi:molybdenum cofactor cytidylyltransferase
MDRSPRTLPAVVLAAGASSRMGSPKALLPARPGGPTFVEQITERLVQGGCAPVVVVTRGSLLAPLERLRLADARLVENPDPSRGQLSSLLLGIEAVAPADAVLVTLVDLPDVSARTITRLLETWQRHRPVMMRPVVGGRHGHPVIFGQPVIAALRETDPVAGAKPVVRRFAAASHDVEVDDRGIVADIDTREEYEARSSRLTSASGPDAQD